MALNIKSPETETLLFQGHDFSRTDVTIAPV